MEAIGQSGHNNEIIGTELKNSYDLHPDCSYVRYSGNQAHCALGTSLRGRSVCQATWTGCALCMFKFSPTQENAMLRFLDQVFDRYARTFTVSLQSFYKRTLDIRLTRVDISLVSSTSDKAA